LSADNKGGWGGLIAAYLPFTAWSGSDSSHWEITWLRMSVYPRHLRKKRDSTFIKPFLYKTKSSLIVYKCLPKNNTTFDFATRVSDHLISRTSQALSLPTRIQNSQALYSTILPINSSLLNFRQEDDYDTRHHILINNLFIHLPTTKSTSKPLITLFSFWHKVIR
jgi:hypothetical protein